MKPDITHLSSVHIHNDVRILYRECLSLSRFGYSVKLLACGSEALNYTLENVVIETHVCPDSRLLRIFFFAPFMAWQAWRQGSRIIHFHDPELLPWMWLLSFTNRKIIFDIHENLHEGIAEKEWLLGAFWISKLFIFFEKFFLKRMSIILAEKSYFKFYERSGQSRETVLNYPDLSRLGPYQTSRTFKTPKLFYIGGVSKARGLGEMIHILDTLSHDFPFAELHIVGSVPNLEKLDPELQVLLASHAKRIHFWGRKTLDEGYAISKTCNLGLCLLHPLKNYMDSAPTKLFEYMAVGLPFVTSNFPFYQRLVSESQSGFCLPPLEPKTVADQIAKYFFNENRDHQLEKMSQSGPSKALELFSWKTQELKLHKMYMQMIGPPAKH